MILKLLRTIFIFPLLIASSLTAEQPPLRIGVNLGLTGAAQVWSRHAKNGIDLAVREINDSGGIAGRKIELVVEDNRTNPIDSVSAYRRLVDLKKVDAIIGSNWSILTNPLIPLTQKDKIPLIAPSVMDASVEGSSPYFFTLAPTVGSLRPAIDHFYALHTTVRTAVFVCWDDAWGRANADVWRHATQAQGVKILAEICQGDYSHDFRAEATRIMSLKPDVVFVGMYAERLAARLRELRSNPLLFTTDCVLEPLFNKGADRSTLEGVYLADWITDENFQNRYRAAFKEEPILELQGAYEAVRSIAAAYQLGAGDLMKGLPMVHYKGIAGPIDFRKGPFANNSDATLMQIRGGKLVKAQ